MRQPPENSAQGASWRPIEAEPGQNGGGPRGRRMRVDVDEPGLDFGDPMRIVRGLGLGQQLRALGVGGKHDLDEAFGAVRRLLGETADARPTADLRSCRARRESPRQ